MLSSWRILQLYLNAGETGREQALTVEQGQNGSNTMHVNEEAHRSEKKSKGAGTDFFLAKLGEKHIEWSIKVDDEVKISQIESRYVLEYDDKFVLVECIRQGRGDCVVISKVWHCGGVDYELKDIY